MPKGDRTDAGVVPSMVTGDLIWAFFPQALTGETGLESETPWDLYPWLHGAAERGQKFYFREATLSSFARLGVYVF